MAQARVDRSEEKTFRSFLAPDLLIIDDLGLHRLTGQQSTDLYELIIGRHRRSSLVIDSNRAVDEWLGLFDDPILGNSALDRLANASYQIVIEGDSYRERLSPHKTLLEGKEVLDYLRIGWYLIRIPDTGSRGGSMTLAIDPQQGSEGDTSGEHTFRLSNGADSELRAFALLNAADDLEQVAGVGNAGRSENPHQALGRLARQRSQLLESHGRVDVVTQHDLARVDVAGKKTLDAFLQQALSKRRIALGARLHSLLEIPGERHGSHLLLLATPVLLPEMPGVLNVCLLTLLGPTA